MSRALRGETVRDDIVEIEPFDRPGVRRTMVNSGVPVRDAEGCVTGAVVAQMDITALVEAERARAETEARFRVLADNMAQLAWMADETGSLFWYNRRWFEYTGTTLDEMRGWGWRAVHDPAHVERVTAKFAEHVATGEPWEDTFPLRGRDGSYRWFLSRAIPVRDERGRVQRWFGTNTDVTAQRAAEEALRDADRRKDDFIAILAHELRNPLGPVRMAVEILRRADPSEPRAARAREIVARQVGHMARLIDDLLDVSRIARGKLALQVERCDLAAIARQTSEDYRATLEGAGLRLRVSVGDAPVWVDGDPVRLAQMIGNLLQNAGRFTEPGGEVAIRAEADAAGGEASVTVVDSGVGIDPTLLGRLFDPFAQADQDLARTKGGLGLGLALTKGLAELHGGRVEAASEGPGRGSVFTIRIPTGAARRSAPGRASSAEEDAAGMRILVIEDNRDAAETLGTLLELEGHQVTIANEGASGLARARALRPDVVISDLGLPGALDGYAVARAIRAEPTLRAVPLIALSGYANEDARRRSLEAGFDAHLAKPPDLGALMRTLRDARRRGPRAPAPSRP
jgi:PAS domain S-box-containing protein